MHLKILNAIFTYCSLLFVKAELWFQLSNIFSTECYSFCFCFMDV